MYGNEQEVGRALRDSGLPRDEVFITTKLPSGNAGRERADDRSQPAGAGQSIGSTSG